MQKRFICRLQDELISIDAEIAIAKIQLQKSPGMISKVKVLVINIQTEEVAEYSSPAEEPGLA